MHLICGAEVDPALRPVLLVTLMGSLAGSSAWNFMSIWAVKQLRATSTQLSYGYLLMAAAGDTAMWAAFAAVAVVGAVLGAIAIRGVGRRRTASAGSAVLET